MHLLTRCGFETYETVRRSTVTAVHLRVVTADQFHGQHIFCEIRVLARHYVDASTLAEDHGLLKLPQETPED